MKKKDELLASDAAVLKTPGMILKAAREAQNLTLDDISQRILLRPHIIREIEDDNYSHVFARVYAEGYLKSYAKVLGIAPDELLTALDRLIAQRHLYSEEELMNETSSRRETFSILKYLTKIPAKVWYGLLALFGMGIVGLIAVLWLHHQRTPNLPTTIVNATAPSIPGDKIV